MRSPLRTMTVADSLPRASPLFAAASGPSPSGALTGTVDQHTLRPSTLHSNRGWAASVVDAATPLGAAAVGVSDGA